MDFTEEKTPSGKLIKILFKKWQFLAFDKNGKSIYTDREGKSLLHNVPLIVFLGNALDFKHDYDKNYYLLKIRKGEMILPYLERATKKIRYLFIPVDKDLDMIPVRMLRVNNVAEMVKEYDISLKPDYIIIDDEITSNDIIIVHNRYKIDENNIIPAPLTDPESRYRDDPDLDLRTNLNIMSENPVYLAIVHIRSRDYSRIYQLLLDFELTALDTEYILNFINNRIDEIKESDKNSVTVMLKSLQNIYTFYHHLLRKSDDDVKEMIANSTNLKQMTSYRTLISKVKAQYPGTDEQILYTEYENILLEKWDELDRAGKIGTKSL